jgi:HSP20 family protein
MNNNQLLPFDRLIEDFAPFFLNYKDTFANNMQPFQNMCGQFNYPKCNLEKHPDRYVYCLDVPGMNKDELKVEKTDTTLTVSGKRLSTFEDKKESATSSYVMKESRYGSFTRTFKLESDAKSNDMTAKLTNGVLCLTIPRNNVANYKQVDIACD